MFDLVSWPQCKDEVNVLIADLGTSFLIGSYILEKSKSVNESMIHMLELWLPD